MSSKNKFHKPKQDTAPTEDVVKSEEPTLEVLPEETVVEVVIEQEPIKEPTPEPKPKQPLEHKPMSKSKLETELALYVEKMSAKLTEDETGKVQYGFFRSIRQLLSLPSQDEFNTQWNIVLKYARDNKGTVFNEENMFRGAGGWAGSDKEFSIMRRLSWLILSTRDAGTRRTNLLSINMEKVVEGLTETERTTLLNYYGI